MIHTNINMGTGEGISSAYPDLFACEPTSQCFSQLLELGIPSTKSAAFAHVVAVDLSAEATTQLR